MARAKKLPSGSWRVRVYDGKDGTGKAIYKSFTADDKKTAEFMAAEYKIKHKKEKKSGLTFDKAVGEYIEAKRNLLSPSTIRSYEVMQRTSYTLLKDKKIDDLVESNLIQQQINENAKKYSAKSLRNQLGLISAVMKYNHYYIGNITLKPKEHTALPMPTEKDSKKIMQLLKTAPDIECQALLALTCSLRQSEIAGIHVEDVNKGKIFIHGARVYNDKKEFVYKPTNKSSAGTRVIDMPPYLTKQIAKRCKDVKSGFLFDIKPGIVLKRFQRLLIDNNIPPYTMHSLRHCFAATLHAQNVPDKYIMEMGGWSSNHVLQDIYQYTFKEETSKIKKKSNNYFENILKNDMKNDITKK